MLFQMRETEKEKNDFQLKQEDVFIKAVTGKTVNEIVSECTLIELIRLSQYISFIKSVL